jgi:polysaccharide deacetylase 2 family uncharacterized protein YibQ
VSSPRPRPATSPAPSPRERRTPRPTAPPSGARVAILIDDLGNDRAAVRRIASWPYPVAAAVLPGLPGSADAARALTASGKEVLLHLPMEPNGYPAVRPGPGVVLRSQSEEEIASTLEKDLDTVPGASGINNHMGSAATADPRVMRAVARVLARRGLFFVDSRTTVSTVARDAAQAARVPATSRRIFLDDVATPEAVRRSFEELLRRASSEGEALAIGHPHAATLDVLEREIPNLPSRGVKLVRVRDLVK